MQRRVLDSRELGSRQPTASNDTVLKGLTNSLARRKALSGTVTGGV